MTVADNSPAYHLDDRYERDSGRVFMTGSQALARLPYEQLRADRAAGRNVAAFVCGYPGSPLAGYDRDVTAVSRLATKAGFTMVVRPGLNEELAATAVMGSQLAATVDSFSFDGVVGIWYGKAPGIDRASDAMRHAVFAGTSSTGGAVALVGDDPKAKSSTLPSSSDATMVDLHMPVFFPADVQEAIDLGRHAIALSRACGLWSAIKVVDAVADGTGTVDLHSDRIVPIMPVFEVDGVPFVPRPSGRLLTPYSLDMEREFHDVRLEIARLYGIENNLNRIEVSGADDWIGIVATGQTYNETVEALGVLGLTTADAIRGAGIRLLKLSMPIPHDANLVRRFAAGLREVVVVEEKNPTLESMIKDALYACTERPVVCGKLDPSGNRLLARTGGLDADNIAPALRSRLTPQLSAVLKAPAPERRQLIPLTVNRTPYFCSGCPHNTSTKVPDGTLIGAGIGCHSMVMMMDEERVGHLVGLTAMGNEGAQWIGMAPFVDDPHLIQNLGDGTLFHSGILAIRAAAASGVNITYKILYNGAVSMTGGQDPTGQLDVPHLVRALLAEGVTQVLITTDDLPRYADVNLPDGVKAWGRQRLIEAQELLATVPGCTVLIHDQRCAAELRRDRKRGKIERPGFRVLINERVCEGCGDCGDVSNCLSVQPVDTPFGRKTRIDQSSCNFDMSCMQGDCPSFATVTPRRTRRQPSDVGRGRDRQFPVPPPAPDVSPAPSTIRMSGIGGTGVVTMSQILGTAAMLDGYHVRGLDQTGLSQKAGTVVSDLRFTLTEPQASNKATHGSADVVLAFDQLAASSDSQIGAADASHTVAIVNAATTPTATMVVHPERAFPQGQIDERFAGNTKTLVRVDASAIARGAFGDDATTNVLLLGVAVQSGAIPVRADAIERAIELNGVAVEKNLAAFGLGRSWVTDPDAVMACAALPKGDDRAPRTLDDHIAELTAFQNAAYANRFRTTIANVAALGDPELTDVAAASLFKLMAYKDEYEVARLLLLPSARAEVTAIGGPGARRTIHLHPPLLRAMGMRRKLKLRRTAVPMLTMLRALRRLRGTPFDVFGYASLRRTERAMVNEFIGALDTIVARVNAAPADERDDLLSRFRVTVALPERVRGYEHLKVERAAAYRAELARQLDE